MELSKEVFLQTVDELLNEEGLKYKDLFEKTSINSSTWGRIKKDPTLETMPHISQLHEMCELLNTTLNYLLYRRRPKQATPGMIDRMAVVMDAFTDRRYPDKQIIIDRIVALDKHDALIVIRKMTHTIIESLATTASLRGEDASPYLAALERRPTG